MNRTLQIILASILLISNSCLTNEKGDPMGNAETILSRQIKNNKTPGLQYCFFDQDTILFSYYSGKADIENQKEVTRFTTFNAYSTTKTFTSLAILQLAEKDSLRLDDRASDILPDFQYPASITIKQLLAHSSGIPNPLPIRWIHTPEEHQTFDRDRFFLQIFTKYNKTKSGPNERFAYSNLGYVILGQIIEHVSGQSYEAYIRENVLTPLSLNPDQLDFTIQSKDQHAKGYQNRFTLMNAMLGLLMDRAAYRENKTGKWASYKNTYVNGTAYGGLIGNAGGFVVYLQELLKTDNRLISEEYKQLLFTENILEDEKKTGMCLSWFKGELIGQPYFAHAGGGFYYCEIRLYPELGKGSVIMFNRAGMSDTRFLDNVDRYFLEE